MSRIRNAKLASSAVPLVDALNTSLERARLPLCVDREWQAPDHAGYVACTLDGEDAGFELKRSTAPDGQVLLTLRWGGDQREHVAQLGVLYVLAKHCAAQVSDPETGTIHSAAELLRSAHELIDSLKEVEG